MPKITEMFCFAIDDKDADDEGVPAIRSPLGPLPLVGADLARLASLMPRVQEVANELGKPLRIYHFTNKKQIGEVRPQAGRPFIFPDRCWDCNAVLMGGMTNHVEACTVRKLIDDCLREARSPQD